MALATVLYRCGHEFAQKIYGKWRYRDWYQNKLEKQLCPKCQPMLNRPEMWFYFRHDTDAADIFLVNCKELKDQLYYSRRRYRFVTEEDCERLPLKQKGWYKRVKPADRFMDEWQFCKDIGIYTMVMLNDPPPSLREKINNVHFAMQFSTYVAPSPQDGLKN